MILSDREIRRRLDAKGGPAGASSEMGSGNSPPSALVIDPYSPESQQPASYDLRAAESVILPRGICALVPSLEWVELPADLAATLRCRSSYGRRGVVLTAGFVDPGFRGQLTLCLVNNGTEDIAIHQGERIVQMILQEVRGGDRLYNGQYQDSSGAVEAREA